MKIKENKTEYIRFRVTAQEKERFAEYCEKKGLKMSDFIRSLINRAMALEEKEK